MSGLTRRTLLGAGAAGGLAALTACGHRSAAGASAGSASSGGRNGPRWIGHLGPHQPGITTAPPAHALIAAFDTTAADRSELRTLLRVLGEQVDELTGPARPPSADDLLPPPDNGILGPVADADDLTVTVGFGASLFDDRYGLAAERPAQLVRMPVFPNDEPHPATSHGDLVVQICAGTEETIVHALRQVMRATRASLTLRWMQSGFARPDTLGAGRVSTRNLLGFKDGTANPSPADTALMDELVWVQPGDPEPAWAIGGTYQVVRVIRARVELWDRTALRTQELVIGRTKADGAPLDGTREEDVPDYGRDPEGTLTPLTAHIRLANPRTPATERNRILRRGFNYANGFGTDGQLDQGLLFVCFQRDLDAGFVAVQRRLDGEPLEEYIRPVGGGWFFVPPGRSARGEPFAAALVG